MIKSLFALVLTFGLVYGSFELFRSLTKREKWEFTKQAGYSIIVGLIAFLILSLIVLFF